MTSTAGTPLLELHDVSAGYGQSTVLRHISLVVPPATVTALVGPNGAGKTTLLRTIAGFVRPSAGSILLEGEDLLKGSPTSRSRRGLCHIPEGRGIFPSLTVRENLVMQCRPGEEGESLERVLEAFPHLADRLRQLAGTMSGGEQQMLAMAAAYVARPKVILVDEPSLGLAPVVVDAVFEFLEATTAAGPSLLIVDQYVSRALQLATQAYVLRRGEIVYAGTSGELLEGDVFSRYLGN